MAKDVEMNIGVNVDTKSLEEMKELLEQLKESAKNVPLGSEQSNKIKKNISVAEKAFNAGDWDGFRTAINKTTKTLTQALAATGNISEALQKAIDLKNNLEKQLNQLQERETQIRSRYTKDMSHFLKSSANANYKDFIGEEGPILSKDNKSFSRDDALASYQKANDLLTAASKIATQITNDMARQAGFASRQDYFKAGRYAQQETAAQEADIKEIKSLQTSQTDLTQDIAKVEAEIKKLQPASEEAAKGLEDLYKQIVNISSQLNKGITTQKNELRQNAAETTGGGAAKTPEEFGNNNKGLEKQSSTLGKVFKQWTLYNIALRNVKRALREAEKTVKDLDKALTEQAMVTGLTRKQAYELLNTYQDMAKSLGATTKEVASTMTAFLRQGRSIQEATELSNAAIAAAKVASISTADSVNYLTTAINGFRLSAEDAMKVSDKFAAVAATAATSYEEIAIAMSKVAAQANLAGMSIDYTTALLTKGLETTREAPETIGTALKTVIARMRELTDYGATLEDGMNINNVEKQLSYVGIELRNQNGELRSTEDVLNELGSQWDKLSSNQQAAIAKALAGTRQQSRLIAMMQDYDRVIELQEIAERSQGATLAQMSTYLEGMDAALNKVNIAWEKIVSTIVDSDVIINFVNYIAGAMETIGDFLSTDWGLISTLTIAATIGTTILANKIQEVTYSRMQQKHEKALQIQKLKNRNLELDILIAEKKQVAEVNKKAALENLTKKIKEGTITSEQAELERNKIEAKYMEEVGYAEQERLANQQQLNLLGESNVSQYASIAGTIGLISGGILSATTGSKAWLAVMTALSLLIKAVPPILDIIFFKQKRNAKQEKKDEMENTALKGQGAAAKIISQLGVWGIPLAIATAAIFGVVLAIQAFNKTQLSDEEQIEKMSASIYKLSEKSQKIDSVVNKFEALDNQILKTNKDFEEMDSLLQSIVDSLDEEQQKEYNSLQTNKMRLEYLKRIQQVTENELNQTRQEQKQRLRDLSISDIETSATLKDALYALNNNAAYEALDKLEYSSENAASATRRLTQSMLEELSVEEQRNLLLEDNAYKLNDYAKIMHDLAETLDNTELTLAEQIAAYEKAYNALGNDPEAQAAFEKANQSWIELGKFSSEAIDYIDKHYQGNIDAINQMSEAIQKLGDSYKNSAIYIDRLTTALATGVSLKDALISIFGVQEGSTSYNNLLNAYDKAFNKTILDIGQNLTSFTNQIKNFYDQAAKWNSMTNNERFSFISENADLFAGETGEQLRKALETGNYVFMQEALTANENLLKQREARLLEIEDKLLFEESRISQERNQVYINELKQQKAILEDIQNLYLVSLQTRLEQQNKELEAYKDYLNKQKDALETSLNKRKDAYQKYFDTINQEAEDEDYEEQASKLITNLQKISSSDSITSAQKTKELEQQLQDLEKERLQTLRERAQEQVITNIENEVTEINDKFDKLLESNQLLLQAMLGDVKKADFLSNYLGTVLTGKTRLEVEDFINNIPAIFGNDFNSVGNIKVREENGDVIINVGSEEINLTQSAGQDFRQMLADAFRRLGLNINL